MTDHDHDPPREPMTLKWIAIRNAVLLTSAAISIWVISEIVRAVFA